VRVGTEGDLDRKEFDLNRFVGGSLAAAVAAAVCVVGAAASNPGEPFHSSMFQPPFTVRLPTGWIVAERNPLGVQFYKSCRSCPDGGEEHGEVTLDSSLSNLSVARAIKLLHRTTSGAEAGPVHQVAIGSLQGMAFTARRIGRPVQVPQIGYSTDPTGQPLLVLVVKRVGKTLTILVDSGPVPKAQAAIFTANADALLKTLKFST